MTKPFNINPYQLELTRIAWQDPCVKKLLAYGPSRSGKSAILTALIVNRALAYPGTKHAAFRLTLRSCNRNLFNETFPEVMAMLYPGYLERADVRKVENLVEFHNGSKLIFEGLDPSRLDKVLGAQYATAWINECNEIKDYEVLNQLASRMADTAQLVQNGQPVFYPDGRPVMSRALMLFDCNPSLKSDWDHRAFIQHTNPLTGNPFKERVANQWKSIFLPAYANKANLTDDYLEDLADQYEGSESSTARFLEGRWRDDNPNALFRRSMFEFREVEKNELVRIVVGVDPAGTSGNGSDMTGIVVVGLGWDGNAYVLQDGSIKGTPEQWAAQVANLYDRWDADLIVAEKNYGGEMVEHTIRTARRNLPVKMVNATRSKIIRAEPVQMLYLQKKVFHNGDGDQNSLKFLEEQMCDYKPETRKSPDRMDALVWALTELMKLSGGGGGTITVKRARGVWRS